MGAVLTGIASAVAAVLSARPSDVIYGFKWIASYLCIRLHHRRKTHKFDLYDFLKPHDPIKCAFLVPNEEITLESPLSEKQLSQSADEVFFCGTSTNDESLFIRLWRGVGHKSGAFIQLHLRDGRTFSLSESSGFQQSSCEPRVFSCGNLQLYYLKPMRRWRLFFNGMLRKDNGDTGDEKAVHVKFSLLWSASSDVFDFESDISVNALASSLARTKWTSFQPPLDVVFNSLDFYVQSGVIMGDCFVEDQKFELYLFGQRMRIFGDISTQRKAELQQVLLWTPKNGRFVHIVEATIKNVIERLRFGFVIQPSGMLCIIADDKFAYESTFDKLNEDCYIQSNFEAHNSPYSLHGTFIENSFASIAGTVGWKGTWEMGCFHFKLNSLDGKGVVLKQDRKPSYIVKTPIAETCETTSVVPLVTHFCERLCQNSSITGGKGSSLGKLSELSKEFQNFVVPNGFVITTAAYEKFLSKAAAEEINNLEGVLYGNKEGDLKEACQKVSEEVVRSDIPDQIREAVTSALQKAFNSDYQQQTFAVRSSATGEDTEQMSAAGQMETFLGVSGINEVMSAIKQCWASQFSHIAVQYKRQNGQIINCPMAVVVQAMVPCDVAGVLFTCDPLTGNPAKMSITGNYGLGESVVSGSEEPDTIEIDRSADDELKIGSKLIGAKSHRIVMKDDVGTNVEEISDNEQKKCCMTDEMALRLGSLAAKIEKQYRSHRDIEWGFWNNNLYIFQSRPVTSGTGETDFEIDHEFDAPMRVENESFSVANVGEVMPGACSPLGLDVIVKYFDLTFQGKRENDWQQQFRFQYYPKGFTSMLWHMVFYTVDLMIHVNRGREEVQMGLIGMFGRVVDEEELFEMAHERHSWNILKQSPFMLPKKLLQIYLNLNNMLRESEKFYRGYKVQGDECRSAKELFYKLMYACSDLSLGMRTHMICSEASMLYNIFIFTAIRQAKGEINAEVYQAFSRLVTNSGSEVESADVPSAIQSLAFAIGKDIKAETFKSMSADEALSFLETTTTKCGKKYKEFITKHGHRCLREFDVHSVPWRANPMSLIPLLQNLVGAITKEKHEKREEDIDAMLAELKCPFGWKGRLLLKFLIPQSRKAVQARECSKSLLIRGVDSWRKGYVKLSQMMVSEGRIPDQDLLFYMTMEDILELLTTRSPRVLAKANHRRRRQPILDKYIFPELISGMPKALNDDDAPVIPSDDDLVMKAIPVSQGVARGFARVALTLEEASLLKPGEILITFSTDIGWSPYFPILSGVVTEIGGLISHGAVVSREYGLPCIAGAYGATKQFQTGDYVLLDGNKGLLHKLPKPES